MPLLVEMDAVDFDRSFDNCQAEVDSPLMALVPWREPYSDCVPPIRLEAYLGVEMGTLRRFD